MSQYGSLWVDCQLSLDQIYNLKRHPICKCSPRRTQVQQESLKDSIITHGPREPIKLYNQEIVDGYHRWLICKELDLIPPFLKFVGSEDQLLDEVIQVMHQQKAPHMGQKACSAVLERLLVDGLDPMTVLTPGQEGSVAVFISKQRPRCRRGLSMTDYARRHGITKGYVSQAWTVLKFRPELFRKVYDNKMFLSEAFRIAKTPKPNLAQQEEEKLFSDTPTFLTGMDLKNNILSELKKDPNLYYWLQDNICGRH